MNFKITSHIAMFIFVLMIGAFTSMLPLFNEIPPHIGWGYYVMQILIIICAVLSGLNAWIDVKHMIKKSN